MTAPADRRLIPATERVALESLRGILERPAYTPGQPMRLVAPLADLCRAPGGARDRQLNFGADLVQLEQAGGWAFVQAAADGYCGWVRAEGLSRQMPAVTHRVTAPATHVYAEPDMKTPESMRLSLGARLSVIAMRDGFARLAQGQIVKGWIECPHHRARFRLSDGVCGSGWKLPALKRYATKLHEGMVLLPDPLVPLS